MSEKPSIHKKLQQARFQLSQIELRKSAKNDYTKRPYFELADFMPQVTKIFNEVGLCGVVDFGDKAVLNIHDTETDSVIKFTSEIVPAGLKGATPIQELGAAQTYIRRYLWMQAMDITEHDSVDAIKTEPEPDKPVYCPDEKFSLNTAQWKRLIEEGKQTVTDIVDRVESGGFTLTDKQLITLHSWEIKIENN